jgi:hypothetical protein
MVLGAMHWQIPGNTEKNQDKRQDSLCNSLDANRTPTEYKSGLYLYIIFIICIIQDVPLATEPGISLILFPLMRILQRNLKRTYLIV